METPQSPWWVWWRSEVERAEWTNPENWGEGLFGAYSSRRDPRLWVPARSPWLGVTLNLGHPWAGIALAGLLWSPFVFFTLGALLALWTESR
jgi:uncharacterized membrane protein